MISVSDNLLPCPFCGGEPERITIGEDEPNNAGGDVICCKRCQASSHVEFGRKENLVSLWNTRTEASNDLVGEIRRSIEQRLNEMRDCHYTERDHCSESELEAILENISRIRGARNGGGDATQRGDEIAAEMRAYFEANKQQRYVEGNADNLMLGLLNIARMSGRR